MDTAALHPIDVLVALKLAVQDARSSSVRRLASELEISKSLAALSLQRLMALEHGPVRGRALRPLHPNAARAAARDPRLHKLLALVDAFRIGRARDREVASAELRSCL
jgi:hypothetical protein